jgi:riboflavin kinase/FMN adenylyltransferase
MEQRSILAMNDSTCSIVSYPHELAAQCPRIAVAIGVFDGVHIGHQLIVRELQRLAAATDAVPVLLFFDPHPRAVLSPGQQPLRLSSLDAKIQQLQALGLRHLLRFPFTRELAALSPKEFLEQYFFIPGLTVTAFCVGHNWRFGKGNSGDGALLTELGRAHGAVTSVVSSMRFGSDVVSSTRIRQAVAAGELDLARAMLGRPYSVSGTVRHGRGIGGKVLRCPTANIAEPDLLLPPFGIYAARGRVGQQLLDGVVYIGDAPTIRNDAEPEVIVELHLFSFAEDLYDKQIEVIFHRYLRPSVTFADAESLSAQIQRDISAARKALLDA